jgi:hypothetical protein
VTGRAIDPDVGHARRRGQGEDPGQRIGGIAGVLEVQRLRAARVRPQPYRDDDEVSARRQHELELDVLYAAH